VSGHNGWSAKRLLRQRSVISAWAGDKLNITHRTQIATAELRGVAELH
jgi:hypothetical protein